MPTLVMADLHLSANPRDAYRHTIVRWLAKKAKALGITQTIIAGDLTEEKDRHGDWLTNKVVEHVRSFAELGPVYITQGNHDYYSDPETPFFHFLRHFDGVRWIGRPTGFSNMLGRVLFLPHTRDYKRDWSELSFQNFDYIFAHNTFEGAQIGAYRSAGIPLRVFPKDARVISGDVHIPQRLGCVTYVGAPYTVDFGDSYDARVIVIEGRDVKSVAVKGPQKRLIELDGSKGELAQLDALSLGDILKFKVHLPRRSAAMWPEERDKLRAHWEGQGYVVHAIVPVINDEIGPRVRIRAKQAKTDGQVFDEFVKSRGLDERTGAIGRKLL